MREADPQRQSSPSSDYLQMILSNAVPTSAEEMKKKALEFIEDVTKNADEVQKRVLAEILRRSAHVEYLTAHNLRGRTEPESFKKAVPVVTYEDISPYIQRIANGDTSPILCSEPISEFLTSSGTSGGERKLMPTIEEELGRRSLLYSLLMPVMTQFVPGLETGKGMYFLFIKSESVTPGGLLARPVLTSYYKSPHFEHRPNDPYTDYTSPNEAILCSDSYQSMYSQVLCGLAQRSRVQRVGAVFASGFIRAIKFLEKHWELMCNDIRAGFPNPMIVTDPAVQESVNRVLAGPGPDQAVLIEAECRKTSWQGIITRLWPNTKYVDVIVTGTMAQYIPMLDYYSGGLPLVCTMYASSECYFGLNLNPLCDPSEVAYTILPNMAYFEFLPLLKKEGEGEVEHDVVDPSKQGSPMASEKLVELVDVELGKEYELVLTTYAGLYRYRVGDILRVARFKNKAPQFNFVRRKNVALSIDSDKTDEVELQNAVQRAVNAHLSPLNATLVEYTSYADTAIIPGHYVLFWEIEESGATAVDTVLEECCLTIEESLNSVYRQCRAADKSIGALEIRVVESGTFDKLMDYALSLGASINQYKTPRCVKYAPIIQLLDSRVVSNYFSRACPKWEPGHKQWHGDN